jgi:uncharacterized protein DUF3604
MVGCTLGPEDAYRFARGETVVSSTGVPARLNRPLDFLVVTDYSENLGLAPAIAESNPEPHVQGGVPTVRRFLIGMT